MPKLIGNKFSSTVTNLTKTFTGSGTLTTTKYTSSAQYLVVGGGGAGGGGSLMAGHGWWSFGGGGGAGGFRTNVPGATSGRGASAEPSLTVSASTSYPIVVGAGGRGGHATGNFSCGHPGHGSSFGPDPDADTSLLIQSDTTDGSTTFTDSSSDAHSITVVGNTKHDIETSKIGNSSMYFDGSGDSLYLTDATGSNFDFGSSGDFTFDVWIRPDVVTGSHAIIDIRGNHGDYIELWQNAAYLNIAGTNVSVANTGALVVNTWYHVAVVRSSGTVTLYQDGVAIGTPDTSTGQIGGTDYSVAIGQYRTTAGAGSEFFHGWIDEVRISKGIARYTGNFDPTHQGYITAFGGGGSAATSQALPTFYEPYVQHTAPGYNVKGQNGGSGGGGGFYNNPNSEPGARAGSGTPGQGYDGGVGSGGANVGDGGGGGGGAASAGISMASGQDGGHGQVSSISGSAQYYAGGGGGSRSSHPSVSTVRPGDGGRGGGGNGGKGQNSPQPPSIPSPIAATCRNSTAGEINSGGGGGGNSGAYYNGTHGSVNDKLVVGAALAVAKTGGSGIVIIKEVVPGSITTYDGSVWEAGGVWNMKDVYREKLADNWK